MRRGFERRWRQGTMRKQADERPAPAACGLVVHARGTTMAASVELDIPPLVSGDKLTRNEFLRRWEAMPNVKFAELIGGIVYMPSPLSWEHGSNDAWVAGWL